MDVLAQTGAPGPVTVIVQMEGLLGVPAAPVLLAGLTPAVGLVSLYP